MTARSFRRHGDAQGLGSRANGTTQAVGFRVDGIVQGVGFRPFVHRTAADLGLSGWVANVNGHVEGEVAGPPASIEEFAERLRTAAPALARVRSVRLSGGGPGRAAYGGGFEVRPSAAGPAEPAAREVPPDAALCEACLRELRDPGDRRFRYPFINCTDCGPRATIIEDLPYDRVRTTMRRFPLCTACAAEYADPADRRFHAEPVACPVCGPRLAWEELRGEAALRAAVKAVNEGGIVALKGLGGYQLVCDAGDPRAVAELRRRKRRPTKPFAVMVPDLAAAERLAWVGATARRCLLSPERPVLLLTHRRTAAAALAPEVHPGLDRVGLFLPTTGLHQLLLDELARPLVVTSGNLSDEPIAVDDAEARCTLDRVADGFLTHDRPIRSRYDDSVVQFTGRVRITVRRARGLAPAPLPLGAREPVAGAGAQLKHTFTLAADGRALTGPHTGDLSDLATHDAFLASYAHLKRLSGIEPVAIAHDLHPGYLSTQWATAQPVRHIPVQHHHAHVAACAAEHGVRGPFLGVAYDGLGLGDDGTLWGGEILVADLAGYRRVGRFSTAPLPGGDAAVRRPCRTALGHLLGSETLGTPRPYPWLTRPFTDRLDLAEAGAVRAMIARDVNCPRASSAGRLFDAVAALLGLADEVSYEGEAAVRLEAAAGDEHAVPLARRVVLSQGLWVYDSAPTLADLLERRLAGEPVGRLAAAFHLTLAEATAELVARAVAEGAPRTVCLGGGCFVNRRLLTEVRRRLRAQGLRVLVGGEVPVGDGGISYGQAAVAAARLNGEG
ncbi:carbamoyltransferase HypF [Streptomyces sp. CC219B]|uniref:carbamoyltransferase HypF n=1 Tax=Streptomyces sp. CC219B TaxID=3044574 RepID=UPI0024A8F9AF|nr:carbamoyltransferase HypF [Streptomyces sp. CC219B]